MAELSRRRPALYWTDLVVTSAVAWSSFFVGAVIASGGLLEGPLHRPALALLFVVAVLALYRASSFIHEVTHVRGAMPGWTLAWDVLVGVPLLMPSLLYVGVHTTHHDHKVFGTDHDPEFVPHQGDARVGHLAIVARFAFVPALLTVRWLLLTPLSWAHAGLRRFVIERLSSFAGNPRYRRPIPEGADARRWSALEAACLAWTALVALGAVTGVVPVAALLLFGAVSTCVSVMHGMRSLATHRFHGEGAPRTVEEQFLDSINVTGHPLWTELWAPAGLRYHALHHLAPRLPYHSLGAAHRLLLESLPEDDAYRSVTFRGLSEVVAHVLASAEDGAPRAHPARARAAGFVALVVLVLGLVPSVAVAQSSSPDAYLGLGPAPMDAGGCAGDRQAIRRCRIRASIHRLEDSLVLIEGEIAANGHADDTVPAWLVGTGLAAFAGGLVGTFVEGSRPPCAGLYSSAVFQSGSGCRASTREEHWPLVATSVVLGGVGLLTTITGLIWLSVNGGPYRRRDGLLRRIERLEDQLHISASVDAEGGTLGFTLSF